LILLKKKKRIFEITLLLTETSDVNLGNSQITNLGKIPLQNPSFKLSTIFMVTLLSINVYYAVSFLYLSSVGIKQFMCYIIFFLTSADIGSIPVARCCDCI
jgi:hypothetical protein